MSRAAALAVAAAACHPLPPPPMVALHDDTAAPRVGTTSGLLVIGMAGDLGGGGWGTALRVEQQVSRTTAIGGEVAIGRGDDGVGHDLDLLAVRGYGQSTPIGRPWVAAVYGAGVTWLSSGLFTVGGFAGGAVSVPDGYVAPYLQLGVAPVLVVRRGGAYGQRCMACDQPPVAPRSDVYGVADVGLVGRIGNRGNRLSVDLGAAVTARGRETLMGLSVADGQRFEP